MDAEPARPDLSSNAIATAHDSDKLVESHEDGSFDAYFGECGDVDNNLPTVDGWNCIMRIYEPKLDELQESRRPEVKKIS